MVSSTHFEAALEAALSHLLSGAMPSARMPVAVGFSGGGDSTALLYGLRQYAKYVHVFIVDHNLRSGSAAEAKAAQNRAQNWGFKTDILTWPTAPITSALQAKARRARYGLIGVAMRARGLEYLLTGHTEDDQAETCLMRYDRSTDWRGAAGISPRVYAPVWPELSGISVLRPLLGQRREALRNYNRMNGLKWVEDPSNENRDFTRIRARDYLKTHPQQRRLLLETAAEMQTGRRSENARLANWFHDSADISPHGFLWLKALPPREALLHIIRSVSGQGGMIDGAALARLRAAMSAKTFKAATLGGAQIIRKQDRFLCVRDPVIAKGRRGQNTAMTPQRLGRGEHIWDGRFNIQNKSGKNVKCLPAWGYIETLMGMSSVLKTIPAEARPTLPVIMSEQDNIIAIGGDVNANIAVKALCADRLFRTVQN